MRLNGKRPGCAALAALVFGLVGAPVSAQPRGGQGQEPRAAEETLEALLIVSLKRDLDLDAGQAVEMAAKVKPMLEARRDFAKQQARLRHELADALRSPSPDKAHIDWLIASVFELRSSFVTSQQKSFDELSANMDPVQRGQLFVSLETFEERVRKHLRRLQDGPPRKNRERAAQRDDDGSDDL